MVKPDGYPSDDPSRRRIRTHAEWNVETHIFWATGPTSSCTLCFISPAALLVKVIARISNGDIPRSINHAIRRVSTRVLPDPAPAMTNNGPPVWVTASSWAAFKPPRIRSSVTENTIGPHRHIPADRRSQHGRELSRATPACSCQKTQVRYTYCRTCGRANSPRPPRFLTERGCVAVTSLL